MSRRRYSIIGTGAIGGYYGALLHLAGNEVHFFAGRHAGDLRRAGIVIESAGIERRIEQPSVYADPDAVPPGDVVLVCLKATMNGLLRDLLPRVVAPGGFVVLLQNGLDIEREAVEVCGADRVMIGLCYVAVDRPRLGRVRLISGGRIVLGSVGDASRALRETGRDLQQAGIPVSLTPDLRHAQWRKLLWNIPFNSLSVLLNRQPHEIASDESVRPRLEAIMREVVALAHVDGRDIEMPLVHRMIEETRGMPPSVTSMKSDFDRGRPMELESILAAPLRVGSMHGVETPRLRELHEAMQDVESRCVRQV